LGNLGVNEGIILLWTITGYKNVGLIPDRASQISEKSLISERMGNFGNG
jgi:hypothetical protein